MLSTPFKIIIPFTDNAERFYVSIKSQKIILQQINQDKSKCPEMTLPVEQDRIYKISFSDTYPNNFSIHTGEVSYLDDLDESDNDDRLAIVKGRGIIMIAGDSPFREIWFRVTTIDERVVVRYKTIMQRFI